MYNPLAFTLSILLAELHMKRRHTRGCLALCLLAACSNPRPAASPTGLVDSRTRIPLTNWDFFDPQSAHGSLIVPTPVTVPHTWNAIDGENAGDYFRGARTYRRTLDVSNHWKGKTLVLRFEGVNRRADVLVNGKLVGSHTGGFGAFAMDITDAVHPGNNTLVVNVTNENIPDSPPLSADFTFFGGIYRPAELLVLDPVHISPLDYGSPGIRLSTSDISDDHAKINLKAFVENNADTPAPMQVRTTIYEPTGKSIAERITPLDLHPHDTRALDETLILPEPHRWNGRSDPYLYHVRAGRHPPRWKSC